MRRLIAPGFALVLLVGCGSDGNGSPGAGGTSGTGGSTASGGTATGGASSGGASSGGTGGAGTGGKSAGAGGAATAGKSGAGGAATGGKSGAGGTGGRPSMGGAGTGGGTSSTGGAPTTPAGPVDTCRQDICPLGPCDNGGFFSNQKCTDVYPNPVSKNSMFCAAGTDGGYCLTTITNVLTYWAISCSGGTPTFNLCNAGCKLPANVASCN